MYFINCEIIHEHTVRNIGMRTSLEREGQNSRKIRGEELQEVESAISKVVELGVKTKNFEDEERINKQTLKSYA